MELELMEIIRNKLTELGMSQRELAEKIDISEVSVSRWLNCTRIPTYPNFIKMLDAVGLSFKLEDKEV